jgi:rhodanese-related sulfurtransferase
MSTLDCRALAELMVSHTQYAVFDVRERGEYNACQISGATSLPRSQIEFRIEELVPNRSIRLIVYDEGGTRASLAAATLSGFGYTNVTVLVGGLSAWKGEGRPTVSGVNVPSKAFGERVQHEESVPDIAPEALKQLLDNKADTVILDVRTPEEYGRFCIPGGINVPGGDLILWVEALKRKPEMKVIVNCAGRTRSIIGTAALRRLGIENVLELRNGTMGWVLAGFELESAPDRGAAMASEDSRASANELAIRLAAEERINWISAETLLDSTRSAERVTYLIDVRSADEFEKWHIRGSIAVPGGQAVQRADDFVAVKNAGIIFVSERCARAVMAAYWYRRMGYPDVSVLQGGIREWSESGRELVRGPDRKEPLGYNEAKKAVRLSSAAALPTDLLSRMTIVDVSASTEYEAAHIPGAHWLPRGWLEERLPRYIPSKDSPLLLTCPDDRQSALAAHTLTSIGYTNVLVLEGGVRAWRAAGYGTQSGMASSWTDVNDVVLSPSITGDHEAMRRYLDWEVKLLH